MISTLYATATPTASKIPISGIDGKLANGWMRGNYSDVVTVSGNTTLDDTHSIVLVSAIATISLPTAVGRTGRLYNIIRTGTATVVIDPYLSETISGESTIELIIQWASIQIVSDGSNWVICG